MYAILYIDILGPTFVMSGGAMAPLAPPVPLPMSGFLFLLQFTTASTWLQESDVWSFARQIAVGMVNYLPIIETNYSDD